MAVADELRGKYVDEIDVGATAIFGNGDLVYGDFNPNDVPYALTGRNQVGFWFKNSHTGNSVTFEFHLNTSVGYKEMTFITTTGTALVRGSPFNVRKTSRPSTLGNFRSRRTTRGG